MSLKQLLDERAYEEVKLWIQKITWTFYQKHGGDFHELLAEANFLFAKHLQDYDESKSQLTTFLEKRIRGGLIDYKKREWRHPMAYIDDLPADKFITRRQHTFLVDLLDEIGSDARMVVQKILQPDPILMMILSQKEGFRAARRGLRQYFAETQRWSFDRIDDAFWDLTVALWGIAPFKRK